MGLLGSALIAWKGDWSKYGFLAYLASNLCWIAFGIQTQAWGLVVMQIGFTVTTLAGIYSWFRPDCANN